MASPTEDPNVLAWALGVISTFVITLLAYFSKDRQSRNRQTDDNTKRITKLETTMVNETRVRELLSEGLLPIMTGITNIERLLLENTQKVASLDQRYEINKAVIEERERLLKEIEDKRHE
jgi:hypothetical protein